MPWTLKAHLGKHADGEQEKELGGAQAHGDRRIGGDSIQHSCSFSRSLSPVCWASRRTKWKPTLAMADINLFTNTLLVPFLDA
ncbi:hypothetical protein GW17_00043906 [Ensete ventricosum]|nr:hypothetical protein GW17_00043906 [Ensete ventricosum]